LNNIPDKLTVIESLSRGSFGEVFLCNNTYLLRKEAVKVIKTSSKEESEHVKALKENLFESSVLEYLRKSEYIVDIYDAEIIKGGFRINMEYLENGSLQKLLNENSFLNTKQVIKISECVLHALEYAHSKNIFHLDVKPGNILIKNHNIYKLSDFGLSNIREKDGTAPFKKIYAAHFPPEKLSARRSVASEQSDIYMFGVTLYRILNGDVTFASQRERLDKIHTLEDSIIKGTFPNRNEYLPHVPSRLRKIANKCMNIDLEKRYKTIREIRKDFGKLNLTHYWICKNNSENQQNWECEFLGNLKYEVVVSKNDGSWEVQLMKFGPKSKTKVNKFCFNKLKDKELKKKLKDIFDTYF